MKSVFLKKKAFGLFFAALLPNRILYKAAMNFSLLARNRQPRSIFFV